MKLDTNPLKKRFAAAITIATALLASTVSPVAPTQASGTPAVQHAPTSYTCSYYIVKRGDTLLGLAVRTGVSAETLMKINGLRSNRLFIGQRLCIPRYAPPAPAPGPKPPTSGPWYAEYWNNTSLSGAPALVRNDADVNFNWGFSTPDASRIFADNFSARWTRTFQSQGGTYRFTVQSDDGARLYVDGNLVLDKFGFEGNQTSSVDVNVAAGAKVIRLDYVEKTGLALVRLSVARVGGDVPQPGGGSGPWRGEFYNNKDLSGSPIYVNNYTNLNFAWGVGSPAGSVPKDNWSARFTQVHYFTAGTYRFVAQVDDGVRVYVDDVLVINEWREQAYRTFVGDVNVSEGNHYIKVEYLEVTNQAALRVYWEKR